jgi:hypothetical protein
MILTLKLERNFLPSKNFNPLSSKFLLVIFLAVCIISCQSLIFTKNSFYQSSAEDLGQMFYLGRG